MSEGSAFTAGLNNFAINIKIDLLELLSQVMLYIIVRNRVWDGKAQVLK